MKNAISYTEERSECYKILDEFKQNNRTGKKTFSYRPNEQLALVQAVDIDVNQGPQHGSTPPALKGKKEGPFNLNPKMKDPEYRKHITNLFLASKFKEPKKEDLYYDPMSI